MSSPSVPLRPECRPAGRLGVVDALRGCALLAIVLLHNLEHYNLYFLPEGSPEWLRTLDGWLWEGTFFLLAGKAYATFSLLFGLSFHLQMRNAARRGIDFRGRFAWRMLLLAAFAQLHALFYNGDILLLYAVCGLLLIPASRWSDRTVLVVAAILMLQPLEWACILRALLDPAYSFGGWWFGPHGDAAAAVAQAGTWGEVLRDNIGNGQLYSNLWQIEAGRLFQTPALFLLGMLAGRRELFVRSDRSRRIWQRILVWSLVACIPLHLLRTLVPPHIEHPAIAAHYGIAVPMLANFAMMSALVSLFTLCWFRRPEGYRFQRLFVPYGRMSLTNYIGQSVVGVAVYYQFGGGLWRTTGATACLAIGLAIFAAQLIFSRLWLARHPQGPLEWLWKRGTWLGSRKG